MSAKLLRNKVKKAVDGLPDDKLITVADFIGYVSAGRGSEELEELVKMERMHKRLAKARHEFAQGKGVNWREVRSDVPR